MQTTVMTPGSISSIAQDMQLLSFTLGPTRQRQPRFGVDISVVREVAHAPEITPIPNSESYIAGVISLRGTLMRVVDLSRLLTGENTPEDCRRLIVTDIGQYQQAFLVSGIDTILRVNANQIHQLDEIAQSHSSLVQGVVMSEGDSLLTLLDLQLAQFAPQEQEFTQQYLLNAA